MPLVPERDLWLLLAPKLGSIDRDRWPLSPGSTAGRAGLSPGAGTDAGS